MSPFYPGEEKPSSAALPLGRCLLFSAKSQLKNRGGGPPSGHMELIHVNPGVLHSAVLTLGSACVLDL